MLQSLRRYIGKQGALLALLFFAVHLLPQEMLHSLFPHNDTEDCIIDNSKISVSSQHIHCSFEQIEGIGIEPETIGFTPLIVSHSFSHPQYKTAPAVAEQPLCLFLRGPPRING
jgi:hypothetical protein